MDHKQNQLNLNKKDIWDIWQPNIARFSKRHLEVKTHCFAINRITTHHYDDINYKTSEKQSLKEYLIHVNSIGQVSEIERNRKKIGIGRILQKAKSGSCNSAVVVCSAIHIFGFRLLNINQAVCFFRSNSLNLSFRNLYSVLYGIGFFHR